ncbi:MAG: hypothetical protein ABS36_03840 [Acidobacteria bacterium SCN 69-37]|nr:MAG: hypothetical protein ABS36_03840 [Acidobacteria bacterium SCN 69-37]
MPPGDLAGRVRARTEAAGLHVAPAALDRLVTYLDLLAFWNRRINLTAFDLARPADEAIDRLLVEPVAAAPLVRPADRLAIDLGSGGGSPAIPLAIASPAIEMTMVEVRAKKAAFLREAIRTLALHATVEAVRFEDVAPGRDHACDLVSFRAVRADRALWQTVDRLLAHRGRVLWFGGAGHEVPPAYAPTAVIGTTTAVERGGPGKDQG